MSEIVYRQYQERDIEGLIAIIKARRIADGQMPTVSQEEVEHQLKNPMIDLARDVLVAESDGQTIGMSLNVLLPDGRAVSNTLVHPDYEGEAIRTHFVQAGEQMIMQRADIVPADKPIHFNLPVPEKHGDVVRVYQSLSYVESRRFYEMKIDFDGQVFAAPTLPDDIEIRSFDQEQHTQAVYQAHQESFRDHWGHSEDMPYERWVHNFANPTFDPTLWFIAWDGDEVAGVSLCGVDTSEDKTGHVSVLGVRRNWRKRGLGMALLMHSFHMFQARGFEHVNLGVDAASKTNAVVLYERAGMYVHECMLNLRKLMRGNAEDIVE